ncbi:hypothetical protein [Halocatena marina]|uniref:Uncharacterized protein n=1 Tax=Halocatena marina TaxID=2934937 RepID=A0ABD5YMU7_9EURY|nr:hypothetical protein [Halocatena marina]
MADEISLDGRTLVAVANDGGEVNEETQFAFAQDENRIRAHYSGGDIVDGYLVGTFEDAQLDIRYVQINTRAETATGHSVGDVELLDDNRVRIEDEWEWESKDETGESILEEISQ